MADQPFEYPKRNLTTKNLVKRIDLFYLKNSNRFRDTRKKLTWLLPVVALVAMLPFIFGVGSGEKAFSNGPVSKAHQVFEQNCQSCHTAKFSSVKDEACLSCHDGPAHVDSVDVTLQAMTPGCATCHLEHEGNFALAFVGDALCVNCHGDLQKSVPAATLNSPSITGFEEGSHPEFPAAEYTDNRPLKFNHATHSPGEPRKIRDIELPIACSECHRADLNSPTGDLLPVTFDENCVSCHERELEFDVFTTLSSPRPAPHTRDVAQIQAIIRDTYEAEIAANPAVLDRPLGRGFDPEPSAGAWLAKAQAASEEFLFNRKCVDCHESGTPGPGGPTVREVTPILGRFASEQERSEGWLENVGFSHHAHRAVTCASCHTGAPTSEATSDVLIPNLANCVDCHGSSGTLQDTCAQCHLYHDRSLGVERDRQPVDALIGTLSRDHDAAAADSN